LDQLNLRSNTVVIFTSDNGGLHVPEAQHQKVTYHTPLRAGKGYLYEGGLRVPLFVRWPARVKPREIDLPTTNLDLVPTLLQLLKISLPDDLDGSDLSSLWLGHTNAAGSTDRRFFWHFPHYSNQGGRPSGAVLEGRWKLIEQYEEGALELYDLEADPGEKVNLAIHEAARAKRMVEALAVWRKSLNVQTNQLNANFNSGRHRRLYLDLDPSRNDPLNASSDEFQRILRWRAEMDAALKEKR
jgi:arylsulfatase A-like enzyme